MKSPHALALCAALLGCLSTAACTTPPEVADDTTPTDPLTRRNPPAGEVIGATASATGAHQWLGLPFAEPPVGDLRFRQARAIPRWSGRREALAFGPPCVQFPRRMGGVSGEPGSVVGSEDCLTLNVYAPAFAPGAIPRAGNRLPVMFWIYGGGNTAGASSLYDGATLATERNVIVVSVNYRLGPFGWLRHPALAAEASDAVEASGNFGTLDLVRALEWVQTNIGTFGGDPGNVTVFGESAGGLNVLTLLLSPQAKGLFHRAISQSGGLWASTPTQAEAWSDAGGEPFSSREVLARIAARRGLAEDPDAARSVVDAWSHAQTRGVLREIGAAELAELYRDPEDPDAMVSLPKVFGDGTVLPTLPLLASFERGAFQRVPTILGTNRDEQKIYMIFDDRYVRWWFGLIPRIRDREHYERDARYASNLWKATGADEVARAMARHQRDVWVYRWDWDEQPSLLGADLAEMVGAAHGLEIDFVMPGVRIADVGELLYDEENEPGRLELGQRMRSYWSEFALTGDPATGREREQPQWHRFGNGWRGAAPRFAVFDTEADGGVRVEEGITTTETVVRSHLLDDPRFSQAERCERLDRLERSNPSYQPGWHIEAGCNSASIADVRSR